ncbi:hypothetical protein GR212_15610 [Rhizobium lusitanum]|uniref:Uncharacterized protein n=1 Tax=Rhizobium lusitanum TaxID=293958 RepID=A0A6L9U4X5_9HYPH|nr:hypothetical protein [Rhizobium lusitanum]NEI71005.1 hypothetical protein [Rhizobium lusitanum]
MANPLNTMEWLAAQFRARANDDPDDHTEKDADEVDEAKACFIAMLAALKHIHHAVSLNEADMKPGVRNYLQAIIDPVVAKAEDRADG